MFAELALACAIAGSQPSYEYATVTVQEGDTLSEIGAETGYAWWDIYQNNLDRISNPHDINPGTVLRLPDSRNASIGVSPSLDTVVVSSGDTLGGLASWAGTTWQELHALNRDAISDPNTIHPGMVLRLPHIM